MRYLPISIAFICANLFAVGAMYGMIPKNLESVALICLLVIEFMVGMIFALNEDRPNDAI